MVKLYELCREIETARENMDKAQDEKEYYYYRNILTDLMAQRNLLIEEHFG